MPVAEALKYIGAGEEIRAVDRDGLYTTQTPQSFFRKTLIQVLTESEKRLSFRDEAEAWLSAGLELRCIEGDRMNFKVTWPEDLELAEALAANREGKKEEGAVIRTGIGYDVHRLVPERPLILGGVPILSPLGLLGHSDADALAHAVADALLGAAGLPDIGNLFPASDEQYRGADSMELLRQAIALVKRDRWEVVWVDAVIEAQVPRLNDYLPSMKKNMMEKLENPGGAPCFNVKAKSAEKTGDPGRGRSIACYAIATLRRGRGAIQVKGE
jgi:2-C-methyl-D-erythritol 4-phosphate cytidylyltransferase/2-C-methyl-D-erythritol 2,4-cyclodiphosphate synthase